MNPRDMLLLSLRRPELDYQIRAREALIHIYEAVQKKETQFAKQLVSEFLFCEKTKNGRINTTQEALLVVVLLTDYFSKDDSGRNPLFFTIFEIGKNSRKFLLLKFILTAIAIQSVPALNAAGTYLLDPLTRDWRTSTDFGRLLINEVTFSANSSVTNLFNLAIISPVLVNAMCLLFAENFKDDQLPTLAIGILVSEFMECPTPPCTFTFSVPQHHEFGTNILGAFFRWSVLSELYEETPSLSRLHLKLLEWLSNTEPVYPIKIIVNTKIVDALIDLILRGAKTKEPEKVQRALEKFAQLIQVSKPLLLGNVQQLQDRLKLLPKNQFLDLVIASLK